MSPSPAASAEQDGTTARAALRRWRYLSAMSAGLVAAAILSAWSHRWVCDDAFVSFRYADNLARGWGLVWNQGERVEGFTNLLWTLGLVPAAAARFDLALVSAILGVLSFAVLAGVLLLWSRAGERPAVPLALWVTAAMHDMALWATGGLETMSFAAAASGMAYLLFATPRPQPRRELWAGLAGAACWLLRPDGLLIAATLGAFYLGRRLHQDRRAALAAMARVAGPVALAVLALTSFRLIYYGDLLPNTFYAKSAEDAHWGPGLVYIELLLGRDYVLAVALVLAIGCALWARRNQHSPVGTSALLVTALVFATYVVRSGGDFMFARRLIPVVPLVLMALERLLASTLGQRARMIAAVALTALAVCPLPIYDWWGRQGRIGYVADEPSFYPEKVTRLRKLQGQALASTFAGIDATFMMEGGLCMLAYHSRLPRIIDSNGLTDRTIAHTPTQVRGRPGHEKAPSPEYLAQRRVHFLIRNQFPEPHPDARSVMIANGLVPLRLIHYDRDILRALAARPGVSFMNPVN